MTPSLRGRQPLTAAALVLTLCLAACGGGGGGGDAPPPPTTATPTSGTYAWLLRAEGRTDALKYALSLIHPQDPSTEVVIEPASAAVTDARLVASAPVDVAALRTGTLQPVALIYIVGGDMRRVPLQANGSAPAGRVTRAGVASACRFLIDAVDHTTPERSRFIVSTTGVDGRCDTADDGRAEVRLDATLGLVFAPLTSAAPLAAVRDPATLAPMGWLLPTTVQLWSAATQPPVFRTAADPVGRVVLATHRSVLAESAGGLSVLDIAADGRVAETRLPSAASTGWQGIGFDAQNFFAYRNGGSTAAPDWSMLRVARTAPTAVTLGTGAGQMLLASMGTDVVYASVAGATTVETRRWAKAVPGASTLIDSGPLTGSFSTVITSASGVHLLWRISGLDSSTPSYAIQLIDESGSSLYTAAAGGFSMGMAEATRVDFASSESRTRFLFVEGYGNRFFGDTTLVSYDAAARGATRIGQLPGSAEFGVDGVFASVLAGPASPATGYASRSVGGVVQASGTRVFSFDPASAGSLRTTSRQQ